MLDLTFIMPNNNIILEILEGHQMNISSPEIAFSMIGILVLWNIISITKYIIIFIYDLLTRKFSNDTGAFIYIKFMEKYL